jgi:hypothetical protein
MLGAVKFVAENPEMAKGRESVSEWPLYEAFAKRGIITLSDERDLTRNFGGWDDFFALSQSGVRRTATVRLSERGKAAGTVKRDGAFDVLWLKVATTKVETIIANGQESVGGDQYRVIMGTLTYDIPPDLAQVWEASRGWNHVRDRRFKVLLKYDPFDKQWKMVAVDTSKRTEDFATNNVGMALQSLKLGIR